VCWAFEEKGYGRGFYIIVPDIFMCRDGVLTYQRCLRQYSRLRLVHISEDRTRVKYCERC
jgi:hypothetical protein